MLSPSRYFLSLPSEGLAPIPTVRAYGDQDDHLRLTVLLASLLGDNADPSLRETCTNQDTPWRERKKALKELLEEVQKKGDGTVIRLVDPDALDMGELAPEARWQDEAFQRERGEFFALLLDRFAGKGWELIRPEPRESTTAKLVERDCEQVEPVSALDIASAEAQQLGGVADELLPPALRPLADALVANGHLPARKLARMLEEASSAPRANAMLFEIAYDCLNVDAIEAGKRLSTLRGPQIWNGSAGPFKLCDDDGDWTERLDDVQREAAQELKRSGWLGLSRVQGGAIRFAMANFVRSSLHARATTTAPERVLREQEWLARRLPGNVEESLEVHYHAVESGDDELAVHTATYYGSDLRRIAYALSRKRDATPGNFAKAASIYRTIVQKFDSKDAYAWEYLGYNLAMQYRDEPYPVGVEREILSAYSKACEYDPTNPLYKGRELGFQVRLNRSVKDDFRTWADKFGRSSGRRAVTIFAQRVLEGMSRPARQLLLDDPWGATLADHVEHDAANSHRGWSGVIEELDQEDKLPLIQRLRLVKTAHHGSVGAFSADAWAQYSTGGLVELAVVTRFNKGENPPPHEKGLEPIQRFARSLALTSEPKTGWDVVTNGGWVRASCASGPGAAACVAVTLGPTSSKIALSTQGARFEPTPIPPSTLSASC
jgi:hypothetical protein